MSLMSDYPIIITLPTGETINCKEVPVANTSYSKLVKSDESVAVLYNPDTSRGWSTRICPQFISDKIKQMNMYNVKKQLVLDSKIVLAVLSSRVQTDDFVWMDCMDYISEWIQERRYLGDLSESFHNLQVEFIPKNTKFRIEERDSPEFIEIYNPNEYCET